MGFIHSCYFWLNIEEMIMREQSWKRDITLATLLQLYNFLIGVCYVLCIANQAAGNKISLYLLQTITLILNKNAHMILNSIDPISLKILMIG